jgi:hypothetical protein
MREFKNITFVKIKPPITGKSNAGRRKKLQMREIHPNILIDRTVYEL